MFGGNFLFLQHISIRLYFALTVQKFLVTVIQACDTIKINIFC